MKAFLNKLRNNKKFDRFMKISCEVLFVLMIVSICSFSEVYPFNYLVYPVILVASIFIVLYALLFKTFVFDVRLLFFFSFILFSIVSTIIGTRSFSKTATLFLLFALLVVSYIMFVIVNNKITILYCFIIAFSLFAIFFFVIYAKQIFHLNFSDRLGSYFGNVNTVSFYFFLAAFFSIVLIFFKKHFWLIPLSLTFVLFMLSTGTKKTLLSLFISILIIVFLFLKKHKFIYLIIVSCLVVLFIILINLPFMATMKERLLDMMKTIITGEEGASTWLRNIYMRSAFYLGFKNQLIGLGNEGFALSTSFNTYSHSNASEIFCNYGILGIITFYAPYVLILKNSIKADRINKSICIILVTIYSFLSFAEIYYYSKLYIIIFALLLYLSNEKAELIEFSYFDNPHFSIRTNRIRVTMAKVEI